MPSEASRRGQEERWRRLGHLYSSQTRSAAEELSNYRSSREISSSPAALSGTGERSSTGLRPLDSQSPSLSRFPNQPSAREPLIPSQTLLRNGAIAAAHPRGMTIPSDSIVEGCSPRGAGPSIWSPVSQGHREAHIPISMENRFSRSTAASHDLQRSLGIIGPVRRRQTHRGDRHRSLVAANGSQGPSRSASPSNWWLHRRDGGRQPSSMPSSPCPLGHQSSTPLSSVRESEETARIISPPTNSYHDRIDPEEKKKWPSQTKCLLRGLPDEKFRKIWNASEDAKKCSRGEEVENSEESEEAIRSTVPQSSSSKKLIDPHDKATWTSGSESMMRNVWGDERYGQNHE